MNDDLLEYVVSPNFPSPWRCGTPWVEVKIQIEDTENENINSLLGTNKLDKLVTQKVRTPPPIYLHGSKLNFTK